MMLMALLRPGEILLCYLTMLSFVIEYGTFVLYIAGTIPIMDLRRLPCSKTSFPRLVLLSAACHGFQVFCGRRFLLIDLIDHLPKLLLLVVRRFPTR
jgi:hypothetical protein